MGTRCEGNDCHQPLYFRIAPFSILSQASAKGGGDYDAEG